MTKYRAVRTNGYASKKEAARAQELQLMLKAGAISDLKEQVKFVLIPKQEGERECSYYADFVYQFKGETVTEDVKGMKTPVYRLKRKLLKHVHGITITEV
jgi:hypothetical protein